MESIESLTTESKKQNKKVETIPCSSSEPGEISDPSSNHEEVPGSDGEINTSHRKSKKKRKYKHQVDGRDTETRTIDMEADREEWPALEPTSKVEGFSQKRKSTFESEVQKERPLKMVKRHSEENYKLPTPNSPQKTVSFTDELNSFKKDLDRKKNKKEKTLKEAEEPRLAAESEKKSVDNNQNNCQDKKESTDEDELSELRALLKQRKKQLKEVPHVRLKGVGKDADLAEVENRTPILPCDVQNFLLLSQLGHDCPRFPRWLQLSKFNRVCKTVVLVVEGVSVYDLLSNQSTCPNLMTMDVKAEMVSPYCYNCSIIEELCAVAITRKQKKDLEKKFGKEICPEALLTDKVIKVLRSAFSISSVPKNKSEEVEQKICVPATDKFPRTELLLSAWQLIEEGYPLPYSSTELGDRYPDYRMTKDQYAEVTPSSPMWSLDCEMCLTRAGNELTRVSVVDEQHKTVYESFCLPRNPIINYLTEFSGITPESLKGVTTRLEDIQNDLRRLFPADVILVGQGLGGDMHALKMMHPYVIDTSVIFNLTGIRKYKSKLKKLSEEFLQEEIQNRGAAGHDSVEDSLAALKLVQHKLTKSIEYGDAVLAGLKGVQDQSTNDPNTSFPDEHHADEFQDLKVEVGPMMATSLFKHFTMRKKTVAVIGQEETLAEYSTFVAAAHRENKQLVRTETTENNTDTIKKTCQACKNNNFTLAHVVLGDEDDVTLVDSWVKTITDAPPFNSLIAVVLVGSHKNFSNGACLIKIKKPNMRLKPRKAD